MANALEGLRGAVTSPTEALQRAEARADAERSRADELREAIIVLEEARLTAAAGDHERADQLADQVEGLRRLLSDAERKAREAEGAREAALVHAEAMERSEAERRDKGVLARLRDALRRV